MVTWCLAKNDRLFGDAKRVAAYRRTSNGDVAGVFAAVTYMIKRWRMATFPALVNDNRDMGNDGGSDVKHLSCAEICGAIKAALNGALAGILSTAAAARAGAYMLRQALQRKTSNAARKRRVVINTSRGDGDGVGWRTAGGRGRAAVGDI
jgi:hypothetical protein